MNLGAVLKTVFVSTRAAIVASVPAAPHMIAFALATSLAFSVHAWPVSGVIRTLAFGGLSLAGYGLGCVLSAKMYGSILKTGPAFPARDDVINLGLANAAVYGLFLILSFFFGFFLVMLPGIFVAQSGMLADEAVASDPEAVAQAFQAIMGGPEGYIVKGAMAAAALALIYIAIRLALFGIVTFARGEIRVLGTWEWTKAYRLEMTLIFALIYILPVGLVLTVFKSVQALAYGIWTVPAQIFILLLSAYPALLVGHAAATKIYLEIAPNLQTPPARISA